MLRKKHNAVRGKLRILPGKLHERASQAVGKAARSSRQRKYRRPIQPAAEAAGDGTAMEQLFANLPVAVAHLDRNFHYVYVNSRYARIAGLAAGQPRGWKPDGLVGKNHFTLFPDPVLQSFFRQVLATGQPYEAYNEALPFLQRAPAAVTNWNWSRQWNWSLQPLLTGGPQSGGAIHGLILTISESAPGEWGDAGRQDGEEQRSVKAVREKAKAARQRASRIVYQSKAAVSNANKVPAKVEDTRLRYTQIMYQHLFESSPDANIMVDRDNRIVAVNHQAEKIFGYSYDELAGQPVDQLVPNVSRGGHAAMRAGYMQNPVSRSMADPSSQEEMLARRKDGSVFPVEITLNPIKVGDTQFVLCVVRDISQRVQREHELKIQAEMVRLLQDIAVASNEATSLTSAFRYALERLNRQLGWLIGHAYITDEDGALVTTNIWIGQIPERFAVFKVVSEALRYRPGDGMLGTSLSSHQPLWMNNLPENPQFQRSREARHAGLRTGLAIPVKAGDSVVGLLEFFHEVDIPPDPNLLAVLPHIGLQLGRVVERYESEQALRKSAARLRTVMTGLPVILWVIDRQGRFTLIEGKGVAALQLKPETLLGKNVFEQFDTRPNVTGAIRRALAGEEIHIEITSAGGAVFETYLVPYFDANWAVDGIIGMSLNVSQRKRMEAELEEMQHRLIDNMDNERARLARRLHDGPLQDLFGAFYQIQEIKNSLDDHGQEVAGQAMQTIQGVNATLRVICGELHPNTLVHLGLAKAIRSHAEHLRDRLVDRQEKIRLHLDLQNDSPDLTDGLRLGLYRIYLQLVDNAVEHAAANNIWIRLRMEPVQAVLEVQDDGKGFDNPDHLIELVRQGKLGLVGILERAQGLNGHLDIDTHPGGGTRVRVTVPLIK